MSLDLTPGAAVFDFLTSLNNAVTELLKGATPEQKAAFIQIYLEDRARACHFFHIDTAAVPPLSVQAPPAPPTT